MSLIALRASSRAYPPVPMPNNGYICVEVVDAQPAMETLSCGYDLHVQIQPEVATRVPIWPNVTQAPERCGLLGFQYRDN
jgi:hypothetical protein